MTTPTENTLKQTIPSVKCTNTSRIGPSVKVGRKVPSRGKKKKEVSEVNLSVDATIGGKFATKGL